MYLDLAFAGEQVGGGGKGGHRTRSWGGDESEQDITLTGGVRHRQA